MSSKVVLNFIMKMIVSRQRKHNEECKNSLDYFYPIEEDPDRYDDMKSEILTEIKDNKLKNPDKITEIISNYDVYPIEEDTYWKGFIETLKYCKY